MDLGKTSPEQALAQLVQFAVDAGASDLFFSAADNHCAVQYRRLGIVHPLSILPAEYGRRCLGHIKARASMDTTEKRRPLDGRWIYDLPEEKAAAPSNGPKLAKNGVDLRISIIPTLHGEDATIRLLPHDHAHFVVENLGM